MQLTEEARLKLRQRIDKMSHEEGKGVVLFCQLSGLSTHTLYRLRDGMSVKEDTVEKLVNGLAAYDNYVPPKTKRQISLTESLLSVL